MINRNVMTRILLLLSGLLLFSSFAFASSEKIGPVNARVEIFVTSWCPYCKRLEHFLKSNDIEYTRYDIEADPHGAALHDQLGGGGVPLIRIGTMIYRGFDEEELTAVFTKLKHVSSVTRT